jgi:hypothetical protein
MVNKTSPIKPKAKAKTLNLDKLLIKIRNISSRCDKNGRITGGDFTVKSEFRSVGDSIKNFLEKVVLRQKPVKAYIELWYILN